MRKAKLSFNGIGTESLIFANRLASANIFTQDQKGVPVVSSSITSLTVSFIGVTQSDKLRIEDIATVALIIRAVAEAQRSVVIELPRPYRGEPSRIYRFLERLGFCDLFVRREPGSEWHKQVSLVGHDQHFEHGRPRGTLDHYIPLRWFSIEDFARRDSDNIWHARPTVGPDVERQFRSILQTHGLADVETIDLLSKTMFVELGWNSVLHSGSVPGKAVGVFCGQIDYWHDEQQRPLPPKLTFCIADIGCGIPNALRSAYRASSNSTGRYHEAEGCTENTGIIRYAIDPDSTSRPELPSALDREGFRGLAFVAAALKGRGNMRIRSLGGAVLLSGQTEGTKATLTDKFKNSAIIGTQVIGQLQMMPRAVATPSPGGKRPFLDSIDVILACDLAGECPVLATVDTVARFVNDLHSDAKTVIFDLGYADDGARSLEYLCKQVLPRLRDKWLIFWNIRTPWNQLVELDRWIHTNCLQGVLPPMFVRGHQDACLFGASQWAAKVTTQRQSIPHNWVRSLLDSVAPSESPTDGVMPVSITTAEFVRLTNEINSAYLGYGFASGYPSSNGNDNSTSGFYTGNIHLLKGGAPVARYFSLTKNVTCARTANLRRWVEGFYSVVFHFLETVAIEDARLVLIGFTATMRDVLSEVAIRLGRKCRAYALMTFDVPTKEEIETKVSRGDQVLLLTDVISTGTLVEAVYSLVRRVDANVIGIASLVDTRRATDGAESFMEFGRYRIPMVTCGQIRKPADSQAQLTDTEYWVDPVSLIPSRERSWGWSPQLESKIEKTLDLITGANAAACGHIVDGSRHTSVYINLHRLLQKQDISVAGQISAVCQQRLLGRRWDGFAPSIVLYPSGVSRIESLVQQSVTDETGNIGTVYQTAVRAYVEQLNRIWPDMVPVEVPRAFDPGGGSRCAKTVDVPKEVTTPLHDIIVADDGMWRGTTVNTLTQIALRLGAKRILLAPLLARMSPSETEHLELLHSVRALDGREFVEVCYVFPLILPIPYYGAQECPYEITYERLKDRRSRLGAIARVTDSVIEELKGHTPTHCPPRSRAYSEMWVKLRTYVELASEHQGALENLIKLVERATDSDALLAMFLLFSQEWRLLGRARLRQTVRSTLKQRARQVAVAADTSVEVRIAATTTLRSLFREDFVDLLPSLTPYALEHPETLARVAMQVATLRDEWRTRDECVHFLEAVSDRGPSLVNDKWQPLDQQAMQAQFDLFSACKSLSFEIQVAATTNSRTERTCANELLHVLKRSPALLHNTRPFVDALAFSADTIKELKVSTFASFEREWLGEHEPRLIHEVLPHLQKVSSLLLRVGTHGHRIVGPELSYLEKACEGFQGYLVAISSGLQWLKGGTSGRMFAERSVVFAASRLMKSVLATDSTTMRLLMQLRQQAVCEVIKNFAAEITDRFKANGRAITVSIEGGTHFSPEAAIFTSTDVLHACLGNVLDNLIKYAFPTGNIEGKVGLCITETRNEANEPMLSLCVKNNGEGIRPDVTVGGGGQRAAADLKLFGGHYSTPHGTDELPWRVMHRIDFPTW